MVNKYDDDNDDRSCLWVHPTTSGKIWTQPDPTQYNLALSDSSEFIGAI